MGIYFAGPTEINVVTYNVFHAIKQNPVGRVIVGGIRSCPHDLVFVPMDEQDVAKWGRCDAATVGIDKPAQAPRGVSARTNTFFRGEPDNLLTRRRTLQASSQIMDRNGRRHRRTSPFRRGPVSEI
jgi:hypothetical protein